MLLFIKGCGHHGDRISRFNTSHVTLYRQGEKRTRPGLPFQYISCYSLSTFLRCLCSSNLVSIHLMLLFIACFFLTMVILVGFQYISCYSLSSKGGLYCAKINVSIHLMLLFIDTDGSAALKPY